MSEDRFDFGFETEFGIRTGTVNAPNLEEARRRLAERFPDDVGADGWLEDTLTGRLCYPWPAR